MRNPTIYSFFLAVSPGYKIVETPANLVYLPITLDAIYIIETSLTDQNGQQLNLRGETSQSNFMCAKSKILFSHIKMYTDVNVNISDSQKQKVKKH